MRACVQTVKSKRGCFGVSIPAAGDRQARRVCVWVALLTKGNQGAHVRGLHVWRPNSGLAVVVVRLSGSLLRRWQKGHVGKMLRSWRM